MRPLPVCHAPNDCAYVPGSQSPVVGTLAAPGVNASTIEYVPPLQSPELPYPVPPVKPGRTTRLLCCPPGLTSTNCMSPIQVCASPRMRTSVKMQASAGIGVLVDDTPGDGGIE